MTTTIASSRLDEYRQTTFRLRQGARLRSLDEAIDYVNQRGFIFFWPIKGIPFPSLWSAVAGNREVANEHDDPGHVTWGWKDQMLDKKRWYYAKILRGKSTIISLDTAPYFYALSENFGDPEADYLQLYEDGLLSREARLIFEALLQHGPLNTVRLRQLCHMSGKASNSPFERNLTSLQKDFKILPTGVAEAGAWRYSFIFDLVHRYYPDLPHKARSIQRNEARRKLVALYFKSVGAASSGDMRKLFQWKPADINRTLSDLAETGELVPGCRLEGSSGDYFAVKDLL